MSYPPSQSPFPDHSQVTRFDAGDGEKIFNARAIFNSMFARQWIIWVCAVLGLIIGLWLASQPKKYTAAGTLRIEPGANSTLSVSTSQILGSDGDTKINSELSLLMSRTLSLKTARDLKLKDDPAFWGGKANIPKGSLDAPEVRDIVFARMGKVFSASHIPKSDIVQLTATTTSPLLSARIINTQVNEYIGYIFQMRYGSTERVSKWLVSQLDDLKDQVERDQVELVNLQNKLGVLGLDQKTGGYLVADALSGLTRATGDATVGRIVAEARYRNLEDSDPNLLENEQPALQTNTGSQASLLQNLRNSEAQAAADYAELSARFGAKYPDVKQAKAKLDALDRQIQLEQQRILNQAKVAYSAAAANESMTTKALAERKNEAFRSHDDMVRYVILQREYESHRLLYESLMQHLRLAGINAGLESAQVDVIDIADTPSIPRRPLPYQLLIASILGFFVLGCVLALVIDYFDDLLDTEDEVTRATGLLPLASLATFELSPTKGSFDVVTASHSPYAEGMQLLRSTLLLNGTDRLHTILITSSIPGEGKSTVARNLGCMLSLHGSRVLIIDCDMHKPTLHSSLKIRKTPGLAELLTNKERLVDAVTKVPTLANLYVLPAGRKVQQPANLLGSSRMAEVVKEAEANFDFVILDTPPILSVADPILCSSYADFTLMIVRQHLVSAREARQASMLLRQRAADMIGFVLNATNSRWGRYGDTYRYYGRYGEAEEEKDSE
jgi:succinoglycan biosynthesis transport protein ExoP